MIVFRRILRALAVACMALVLGATTTLANAQTAEPRTLVVYDQPASGAYAKLGMAYAIMLRNLLGHWNATVDLRPMSGYSAGLMQQYDATFYVGSHYEAPVHAAFLADANATTRTLVWFKNNIWQLAWNPDYAGFGTRTGFAFDGLRGLDRAPTAADPYPGFFDTVAYKGESMRKHYSFDAATGVIAADPDIGMARAAAAPAQVVAPISNSRTGEQTAYVVRSGRFWYVADIPFSFIGPRDRYVAFCDLLHDILGTNPTAAQRALVRLEDVGALVDPDSMTTLVNHFRSRRMPFAVAAIPRYEDPLGVWNGGVPMSIRLSRATDLKASLNYAVLNGGRIVAHGYSHQYRDVRNPWSGVSGDDFEFWDIVRNRPVSEDSVKWARGRIGNALSELRNNGYPAFAWEAPHYQMSPNGYLATVQTMPKVYGRVMYYTATVPNLTPGASNGDYAVGQFFPYIVERDHYGQRVLPENLGNIEYDIRAIDPSSYVVYTWQDLALNARYAKVVRDGFASFFFHPFWLESSLGQPGFQDLQSLLDAIDGLGYRWVDAATL